MGSLLTGSGYGTQARLLAKTLQKHGHEAAVCAFYGLHGAAMVVDGIQVFPGSGEDPWSQDILSHHYAAFQADLLITLMDAWVLDPGMLKDKGMNIAHWMPVDCDPVSTLDRKVLDNLGGHPIAMSRFGQDRLAKAGYQPFYAPHSLDMSLWCPLEGKAAAREQLGLADRFLVGVNAANQDPIRKGFGETLAAFKVFADNHDDATLVMHTRAQTRQGINLGALIADLGFRDGQVMLGDQYPICAGLVTDQQMASWHGVVDVLSNCAYGEGFGLAALQSQACGVPVVLNDCSAMTELCGSGWLVQGQRFYNKGHDSWWRIPFIDSIADALEAAYEKARDPGMRQLAREFALAYDADKVYAECWEPILRELCPAPAAPAAVIVPPDAPVPQPDNELAVVD